MVDQTASPITSPLKAIREAHGLVQVRLAVLAGVSVATLVAIEKHGFVPVKRTRERIAAALGLVDTDIWPDVPDDEDGKFSTRGPRRIMSTRELC